jgi:hypothetical protein
MHETRHDEGTHAAGSRELAHRASDGIDVRLFWTPADGRVTVSVSDRRGGSFSLDVAPELALDAFHHPFAYAPPPRDTEVLDVAA